MASMVLYLIAIIILIYYFSLEFNELLRLSPTGRIVLLLLSCLIMYFGGLALTKYIDEKYNPNGYNVGLNCGAAAGQSVMHIHMHLIPRYKGDVDNPRGGVRWVIPKKKNY